MHHNSPTTAGGVGLYIKQCINFDLITKPNLNIEGCEDIWIDVKIDNNKKVVVGAIYRHPNQILLIFKPLLLTQLSCSMPFQLSII